MSQHKQSDKKAPGVPFEKGDPRAGRPKGSLNKFTNLKKDFLEAYETIGGMEELANWAKQHKNRVMFYRMIAQMLPKNVTVDVDAHALALAELVREKDPEMYEKLVAIIAESDA